MEKRIVASFLPFKIVQFVKKTNFAEDSCVTCSEPAEVSGVPAVANSEGVCVRAHFHLWASERIFRGLGNLPGVACQVVGAKLGPRSQGLRPPFSEALGPEEVSPALATSAGAEASLAVSCWGSVPIKLSARGTRSCGCSRHTGILTAEGLPLSPCGLPGPLCLPHTVAWTSLVARDREDKRAMGCCRCC